MMRYFEMAYPGALARLALYDDNRQEAHAIITPNSDLSLIAETFSLNAETLSQNAEDTSLNPEGVSLNAEIPSLIAEDNSFTGESSGNNDSQYLDNLAARQIADLNKAAEAIAKEYGMTPVFKRYFLSDATNQSMLLPDTDNCARSVIQQSPLDGSKVALLVIYERDATYRNAGDGLWISDRGRIWAGDNDSVESGDSYGMTISYLDSLSKTLHQYGRSIKDNCLRTWFFVRDIDNNYAGMVRARNEVFRQEGLTRNTHFIASTGIEGASAAPARMVAFNAFADLSVTPGQIKFLYGQSHLNPTYEYGVAFERGVAVDYGDRRHIYISGTASIDNQGNIVAPGNIVAQTRRMLENIEVLLKEGESGWEDMAHMIVYLRDISDYQAVKGIISHRFPAVPVVIVLAPVCRPGWLIETECMAIKKLANPDYEPF